MKILHLSMLLLVILIIPQVYAETAQISGYVYDLNFEKVEDVVLTIDSTPEQVQLSKDGSYSFDVPLGEYVLVAEKGDLSATKEIEIVSSGTFRLDLILFPDLGGLEDDLEEVFMEEFEEEPADEHYDYILYLVSLILVLLANLMIFHKRSRRKRLRAALSRLLPSMGLKRHDVPDKGDDSRDAENLSELLDDDARMVLDFIRAEGGRTTQKNVRNNLPYSEAKISLILSDLEHSGKIKRFKSGRGNLIRLK